MSRLLIILFLFLPKLMLAAENTITVNEDKKTLMGVIELPMDIEQPEAIEIAKFIKLELKLDQVSVRQVGARTHGIAIQSKY